MRVRMNFMGSVPSIFCSGGCDGTGEVTPSVGRGSIAPG